MLHGTKIENTLFGGPAFGHLMKGDILVKVDGSPVSENSILSDLRGTDIPGSKVAMTVWLPRPSVAGLNVVVDTPSTIKEPGTMAPRALYSSSTWIGKAGVPRQNTSLVVKSLK